MSIDRIRNYIIESARKEAELIIKKAEEQFHNQIEIVKTSLKKQYEEMLKNEEKILRQDMKRALIVFKNDYKMKLLEIKNSVVDEVLSRAINRIQSLPDGDYLELLRKWMMNLSFRMGGELFVNTSDLQRITHDFIENINKQRGAILKLSTTAVSIKGGFILKTEYYEIDYSLDAMVKNLRTTLVPEVGEILQLSDTDL